MIKQLTICLRSLVLVLVFSMNLQIWSMETEADSEFIGFHSDEVPKISPLFKIDIPQPDDWKKYNYTHLKLHRIEERIEDFFKKNGLTPSNISLVSANFKIYLKLKNEFIQDAVAVQIHYHNLIDSSLVASPFNNVNLALDDMVFTLEKIKIPFSTTVSCNEMSWKFIEGQMYHRQIFIKYKIGLASLHPPLSKEERMLYDLKSSEEFCKKIRRILVFVDSQCTFSFYSIYNSVEEDKANSDFFKKLDRTSLEKQLEAQEIDQKNKCVIF